MFKGTNIETLLKFPGTISNCRKRFICGTKIEVQQKSLLPDNYFITLQETLPVRLHKTDDANNLVLHPFFAYTL